MKTIILEDILKCVVVKPEDNGVVVNFEIYNICWNVTDNRPHFFSSTDDTPEAYESMDRATPYIRGHIKWDGCCNYEYPEEGMLHHCGIRGFKQDLEAITVAYKTAAEYMPDNSDLLLEDV